MDDIMWRAQALSTEELETLIGELADLRATLYPQVPHARPDPASGKKVAMQDDAELITKALHSGGIRLWFRSFGYGWMGFGLSRQNALALRDQLNQIYPASIVGDLFGKGNIEPNATH